MRISFKFLNTALLFLVLSNFCLAQDLNFSGQNLTLNDFKFSSKNSEELGSIGFDFENSKKVDKQTGNGIILLSPKKQEIASLQSKEEFGDVILSLDFMLSPKSKFSVEFQNRYKLNLGDSWGVANPTYLDLGGLSINALNLNNSETGNAPLVNATNAPGLWQQLFLKFKASEFDKDGKKVDNARFLEVYVNGILVQQNVELPNEISTNLKTPLLFKALGNVAIRNIKYSTKLPKEEVAKVIKNRRGEVINATNPILLEPDQKPYLLRSFIMFNREKLTHTISVGSLNKLHFTYNPLQGALIQLWKGNFMDVTNMWHERGEPQTASPAGKTLKFLNTPTFGRLNSTTDKWADSLQFEEIRFKGYALNAEGFPTFKYDWSGLNIEDEIVVDNHKISRTLKATGLLENLYARLAIAKNITDLGNNLFVINDREYFIDLKTKSKALIRESNGFKELVIPYQPQGTSIQYAIIW